MTAPGPVVTRIGAGVYRVERDGRSELVYVAGPPHDRWAFSSGRTYRGVQLVEESERRSAGRGHHHISQSLTAPMPATVIKILVEAGAEVSKGDTILVLEAMKMELPLRAPADATITAVNCREGELVQPDTVLVELE